MPAVGQSLPKRDVRVTYVYPSISDIILWRGERRKGREAEELLFSVAASSFFCLPKARDRSKRIENKLTELTMRKTCCVLWRKRY
jgi:hypothetical protein